jgi:hypothetical protein
VTPPSPENDEFTLRTELDRGVLVDADASKRGLIFFPHVCRALAGHGGHDELAAADEAGELTQDQVAVVLRFVPADDQQLALGQCPLAHGRQRLLLKPP